MMIKIYCDDRRINEEFIDVLQKEFSNVLFTNEAEQSYDADALIIGPDFFNLYPLKNFTKLQWVQLLTAGFNQMKVSELLDRNITLCNAKGIYSITIAEDIITKILTLNRHVKYYYDSMEQGKWEPVRKEPEIYHSTVGILGTGSIAQETAKRLKAFDAQVIGYQRSEESKPYFDKIYHTEEGLEELLKQSDYVVITLPLNADTYHLLDKHKISLLKASAVVINIARGEIIEQEALITALKKNAIRGAGLDVMTPEPLPSDHELWKLENVFITPHNSSSSPFVKERLLDLMKENIRRFINQEPLQNIVKP